MFMGKYLRQCPACNGEGEKFVKEHYHDRGDWKLCQHCHGNGEIICDPDRDVLPILEDFEKRLLALEQVVRFEVGE